MEKKKQEKAADEKRESAVFRMESDDNTKTDPSQLATNHLNVSTGTSSTSY